MTATRTNGPCHGAGGGCGYDSMGVMAHTASCPSLHPAQQEPDALTRLERHIRRSRDGVIYMEEALALISEAREEQRKALILERSAVDLLFHSVMAGKDKRTMTDALHTVEHIIEARKP
jgi:hypothetical protein